MHHSSVTGHVLIGNGTYGRVYTATRTDSGETVVVKLVPIAGLAADLQLKTLDESRVMAAGAHALRMPIALCGTCCAGAPEGCWGRVPSQPVLNDTVAVWPCAGAPFPLPLPHSGPPQHHSLLWHGTTTPKLPPGIPHVAVP